MGARQGRSGASEIEWLGVSRVSFRFTFSGVQFFEVAELRLGI
jgi:hypothetical protein